MARNTKLVSALIAFIIMMTIHEGLHIVTSLIYGEFGRFVIHPYGFEVIFRTPVEPREGFKWFVISLQATLLPRFAPADAYGIAEGLNMPLYIVQIIWFVVFLIIGSR